MEEFENFTGTPRPSALSLYSGKILRIPPPRAILSRGRRDFISDALFSTGYTMTFPWVYIAIGAVVVMSVVVICAAMGKKTTAGSQGTQGTQGTQGAQGSRGSRGTSRKVERRSAPAAFAASVTPGALGASGASGTTAHKPTNHDCPGLGYDWDPDHGICVPSASRLPLGFQAAQNSRCLNTNFSCPECVACPREGQCLVPSDASPCCQKTLGMADESNTNCVSFWQCNGRSVGV